ncbi:BamA/TamA family outer membrane protein [Filimonas lacunae]|uniref:BamA/TamA family outer membrane protein n=1 Tax=Filimonas lacunae TaxID=477680 RepID=UPI001356671D|nr:BamA/TamA family outer membrane protein [Filimonas lacunae]
MKNFPIDTPFVYNNKIILKGNLPKDEKKRLLTALENYWDDSLLARREQIFLFFYTLKNPPLFDSVNISRTTTFMNGYLNSQGYYYPKYQDTFYIRKYRRYRRWHKKRDLQLQTTVELTIEPGKNMEIDSVYYSLLDSNLQQLALAKRQDSKLKPGGPYSKEAVASELDRLVNQYRQNGYYLLTRDYLIAEGDTTDKALLQLTIDPFELASRLASAADRRKKNPTVDVAVFQRGDYYRKHYSDSSIQDSANLKPYYIGNLYYFPETKATEIPDTLMNANGFKAEEHKSFTMFYKEGTFIDRPIRDHNYMRRGTLYNEDLYYKTVNNLSNIGAWARVDTRSVIRGDSVDFYMFLVPAVRQNITYDLEASYNTGDVIGAANSLFGIASSVTYRHRNVAKRAIQSATSLRGGVELNLNNSNNGNLIQTTQASASQRFTFPRFITPFRIKGSNKLDAMQTAFSVNASYINRRDYYELRSLVTGWGYEWKIKNRIWTYKPLNIELYALDTLQGLREAFQTNPLLRTAFNTGSVVSQQLSYIVSYPDKKNPGINNYVRFSMEEAGFLLGRFKEMQDRIYQYIKFEGEYKRTIPFRKTTVALRAYGGIGLSYSDKAKFGSTLPFFKQFIAGGPNSMRAWGLRQLGLGSSLLSDTSGSFRDRYGDMQLEVNAEYRYPLATMGSVRIGGALFTDIGNIWNIKRTESNPNSEFNLRRLGKDVAIGIGTGIRMDFSYFLIRVDFGIKLKDPARQANNGWLDISRFTWRNDEFQPIKDATDASGQRLINRNNYAIQLGIGLPF